MPQACCAADRAQPVEAEVAGDARQPGCSLPGFHRRLPGPHQRFLDHVVLAVDTAQQGAHDRPQEAALREHGVE
jgi:hypothetical protein